MRALQIPLSSSNPAGRPHCIALFSGGLDSALAILLMLRQNIEVTALTFMTHFGCDLGDRSSCGSNPYPLAEQYGFRVKLMHLGQRFVDIVKNPQYGRGGQMNVCVDCRLLMLEEAKNYMEMVGADFIITGEVKGQRPFSQVKDRMDLIVRKSGLEGRLLRPLCAKTLPPTEMETSGMIDRSQLESITGRSRKRQYELGKEFGLENYPSIGHGCLLVDEGYSNRLRDLLAHTEHISFDDLNLLRLGRHFRLDAATKAVIGRNADDNTRLQQIRKPPSYELRATDLTSPVTLLSGDVSDTNLRLGAQITARYTRALPGEAVLVTCRNGAEPFDLSVEPAEEAVVERLLIR